MLQSAAPCKFTTHTSLSRDDNKQLKLGTLLALRLVGLSLPQAMRLRCVFLHIHSTVTPCFTIHSINEHMEHLNCTLCALFLSTRLTWRCIACHLQPMRIMHTLLNLLMKSMVQSQQSMSMPDRFLLTCSAFVCCCGLDTLWNVYRGSICGDDIHHPLLCV